MVAMNACCKAHVPVDQLSVAETAHQQFALGVADLVEQSLAHFALPAGPGRMHAVRLRSQIHSLSSLPKVRDPRPSRARSCFTNGG